MNILEQVYADKLTAFGFVPMNHKQPQWFPVELQDCFTATGEKVPGYKAVVNTESRQVLHVGTSSYALVPNQDTTEKTNAAIAASRLDTTGMLYARDMSHEGRRSFQRWVLPAMSEEINGTMVALSINAWNSYDGSRAFVLRGGNLSAVCANFAVVGKEFSRRHVGEIDVDSMALDLVQAAETYHQQIIAMKTWPQKQITDTHAIEVFEQLPGSNKRLQGELLGNWLKAKESTGPNSGSNLWALYNTLTAWSTHGDGFKEATKAYARVNREERVAELIEGDSWNVLAA